jgi:hypothetical protein
MNLQKLPELLGQIRFQCCTLFLRCNGPRNRRLRPQERESSRPSGSGPDARDVKRKSVTRKLLNGKFFWRRCPELKSAVIKCSVTLYSPAGGPSLVPTERAFWLLVMQGDNDQIAPYADSASLSAKLLRNSTLKTYKGFPRGMPTRPTRSKPTC